MILGIDDQGLCYEKKVLFLNTYDFRNKTFFLLHNMGPKIFLFSIIGYILYKIKNFSDPYYLTKKSCKFHRLGKASQGMFRINFSGWVTSTMYEICPEVMPV